MKTTLISYKIAYWSHILIGFGHTITYLTAPNTPVQNEIIITMKGLIFDMFGVEANIFSFYQGFSLMMGLLLIGYGLLNRMFVKNSNQSDLPSNILILNIIISFISVIISLKYFFIVPIIFTSVAFLGYVISLSTKNRAL